MANSISITGDDDELESADFVVCVPATIKTQFTDNIFAFCCKCDVKIQHRPHVPVAPKKICFDCAVPGMLDDAAKGELEVVTSKATTIEVTECLGRNRK